MPRPAPVLSRTPAVAATSSNTLDWGEHTKEILSEMGYNDGHIESLLQQRIAQQAEANFKL